MEYEEIATAYDNLAKRKFALAAKRREDKEESEYYGADHIEAEGLGCALEARRVRRLSNAAQKEDINQVILEGSNQRHCAETDARLREIEHLIPHRDAMIEQFKASNAACLRSAEALEAVAAAIRGMRGSDGAFPG